MVAFDWIGWLGLAVLVLIFLALATIAGTLGRIARELDAERVGGERSGLPTPAEVLAAKRVLSRVNDREGD